MKNFLLLILLTFIFAIPTESDSVVSSLAIDPEERLRKTISKEEWDQVRPFLMRKFLDFLNNHAEESKKKSAELPSTIWGKKHTTPDTVAKEANPSLGTLQEKVPGSHLSIVVPTNLPERVALIETKRPALQSQVENLFDDHTLESALDDILGQGHFQNDGKYLDKEVPDGHFSDVNVEKTRKPIASKIEKNRALKPLENGIHEQSASQDQNTRDLGRSMSIDDEEMKNVLKKYTGKGQFKYNWKNWNEKVHSSDHSDVAPLKLKKTRKRPASQDWDFFLQLLEADREKRDPFNPPYAPTVVRLAPINRQIPKKTEGFGTVTPLDDEMMKSIPDHHLDHSHYSDSTFSSLFWKKMFDQVPGSELSAVSAVNLNDNPRKTMSKEDEELINQILENFVSNEEWDEYLKHSETNHATHSSVPSTSLQVLEDQSALQSVSNHQRIKNAAQIGKILSEEPSISINKETSQDFASSKEIENFSKLHDEWDKFLKHSKTNNKLALGDQTALQLAFKYRRFKNPGEIGKIEPSLSINREISKDLTSSKAKDIFAKLPRII